MSNNTTDKVDLRSSTISYEISKLVSVDWLRVGGDGRTGRWARQVKSLFPRKKPLMDSTRPWVGHVWSFLQACPVMALTAH
jgi:hypothetical protein